MNTQPVKPTKVKTYYVKVAKSYPVSPVKGFVEALKFCHYWNGEFQTPFNCP